MKFKATRCAGVSVIASMALVCITLLTGCDRLDESADLPEIPSVDTRGLEPVVRDQLLNAYAAVKKAPREAAANGDLAMILHAYKHYEAADAGYQRTRTLAPGDVRWLYYHADVLRALGRQDDAISALQQGSNLDANEPWLRLRLAQNLIAEQSFEQALTELEMAMRIDVSNAEARYEYGVLMTIMDKHDVAIKALNRAIELSPGYAAAYYRLADIYRRRGDTALVDANLTLFRQFESTYRHAQDPRLAAVKALDISEQRLLELVRDHLARGDVDRGIDVLTQIIERNPQSAAAHTTLVGVLARRRQFDLADEHFELAYAIEPENPQLFYNLGIARLTERRLGAAEEAFRRMVQLDPENPVSYMMLGIVLERRKNREEAAQQYAKALLRNPNLPEVRLRVGLNLLRLQRPAAAAETLEKYRVANDSASARVLAALAKAYVALERYDDARTTLNRAAEVAAAAGDAAQLRAIQEDLVRLDKESGE